MRLSNAGMAALAAALLMLAEAAPKPGVGRLASNEDVTPLVEIKLGVGRWFVETSLVRVRSQDKNALAMLSSVGTRGAAGSSSSGPGR